MGGNAYIISGEMVAYLLPDPNQPTPPPSKAPLWKRLFGTVAGSAMGPRVVHLPNGDQHFEIPAGDLEAGLIRDFRGWIVGRLAEPSKGSKVVLEYLAEIEPSVFVRGLQRAGKLRPKFYVQLGFSGCAGEAETSAAVATHWAGFWYAEEHDRIVADHLVPFGFTPDPCESAKAEPTLFLPAGDFGYLNYAPPQCRHPQMPAFEMDNCLFEAFEGNDVLERLDDAFTRYMTDGRCRCQLCDPEFGDAAPYVA